MVRLEYPARLEYLREMINPIRKAAVDTGFDSKNIYYTHLACEEIIVNIINYAYADDNGKIFINLNAEIENKTLTIEIIDCGLPFNPLIQKDPDTKTPIENRDIGGLGIFIVKNVMSEVDYKRKEGKNILKLIKH